MNLRFGLNKLLYWFLGLPLAVGLVFEIQLLGQNLSYGLFGYQWISNVCRRVFEASHFLETFSTDYLSFILALLPGWIILTILSCILGYSKIEYRRSFGSIIAFAVFASAVLEDLVSGGMQFLLLFNSRIISIIGCFLVLSGWLIGKRVSNTNAPEAGEPKRISNNQRLLVDIITFLMLLFVSSKGWSSFQALASMDG